MFDRHKPLSPPLKLFTVRTNRVLSHPAIVKVTALCNNAHRRGFKEIITPKPNGRELKCAAEILTSALKVTCLRAFPVMIREGGGGTGFLIGGSISQVRGIKVWGGWGVQRWLFLTTRTFCVNEESCLKLFLLYLVACNYVSTPPSTTFSSSRLLWGLQPSAGNSRAVHAPAMLSSMHEQSFNHHHRKFVK